MTRLKRIRCLFGHRWWYSNAEGGGKCRRCGKLYRQPWQ